jgi:Tfp pilus assembly protein PilO
MHIFRKQLILAIALGICSVAVGVVCIYPYVKTTLQLIATSEKTTKERERQYALRTYSRKALTEYENALIGVKRISDIVAVKKGNEIAFISAIEQAAASSGVTQDLNIIAVNAKAITPWQNTIPYTINLEGTYNNIHTFILQLENLPFAFTMTNIELREDSHAVETANPPLLGTISGLLYGETAEPPFFKH